MYLPCRNRRSAVLMALTCLSLWVGGHPHVAEAKLRQQTVAVEFVEPANGEQLELIWSIRERLERQPGVTYQDLAVRIDTHPTQNLVLALERFDEGVAAFERMDFKTARRSLEASTRVLSGWSQYRRAARDGLVLLARVHASQGRSADVAQTLRRVLLLDADYQAPAGSPPSMKSGLRVARDSLKAGRGSLRVRTKGRAAAVFLNGVRVGATPLRLQSLPVGFHHLRLSDDGLRHWYRMVRVSTDSTITVRMRKTSRRELYRQVRSGLPRVILNDGFPTELSEFKALASSDQAILLVALPGAYVASLYDLSRGRLVRRERFEAQTNLDELADRVVHRLYNGLDPAALIVPRTASAQTDGPEAPTTSWLYWGGIGLGVAAAVIIPTVLLLSDDGPPESTGLKVRF